MIRIMKYGEVSNDEIFARAMPTVNVTDKVAEIIRNVRERGDEALREYTEKFDGAKPDSILVTPGEMEEALAETTPEFMAVLEKAAANIRKFHTRQVRNSFIINDEPGVVMGQKVIPVDRAGVYVPGGTAPLSSTVLMDVIPAKIAGVKEVILATPPGKDGKINAAILAAAKVAGADKIVKAGDGSIQRASSEVSQTEASDDILAGALNL